MLKIIITSASRVPKALFVFSAVTLFYFPILLQKFGYHNDYRIWEYVHHCCLGYPETVHLLVVGRPILAVLLNIQLMFVSDMQSLQIMHAFSVLVIAAAATLYFSHLQNILNINRCSAALLSVITFTLPSMVINSFWVANFASEILPILIAIYAHILISKFNQVANKVLIVTAVFILIFISLFIYPPATLFFATLTFIKFLYGEKNSTRAKLSGIFAESLILLSACAVYFLSIKYIYTPYLLTSNIWKGVNYLRFVDFEGYSKFLESSRPIYSFHLASNLSHKIAQCQELLIFIVSAWFPPIKWYWANLLALGLLLILAIATVSNQYLKNFGSVWKIFIGLVIFILSILLTALPILVASSDFEIVYRVCFASMAILPAIIVFVLDRAFVERRNSMLGVCIIVTFTSLILVGEFVSLYRLVLVVDRSSAEYHQVIDAVSNDAFEQSKEIRLSTTSEIPPPQAKFLYQDFGLNAMWPPYGIVHAASQDINRNLEGYSIVTDVLGPRYDAEISEGITFNRNGEPRFIRRYKGISGREAWGRWTDGEEAIIYFVQPLPRKFTLKITSGASSEVLDKPIKIIVGESLLEAQFSKLESSEVALPVTTDGNARSIAFKFPNIKSPKELGLSPDPRHLGLALIKLQISP